MATALRTQGKQGTEHKHPNDSYHQSQELSVRNRTASDISRSPEEVSLFSLSTYRRQATASPSPFCPEIFFRTAPNGSNRAAVSLRHVEYILQSGKN